MTSVYFIQSGAGGPIKIGVAEDVAVRLRYLQCGNPAPLTCLAHVSGSYLLETRLHREFRADWIAREWFEPSARLLQLIAVARSEGPRGVDDWLQNASLERAQRVESNKASARTCLAASVKAYLRRNGMAAAVDATGACEATIRNAAAGRCILNGPPLASLLADDPSAFTGLFERRRWLDVLSAAQFLSSHIEVTTSELSAMAPQLRAARQALDVLIERSRFAKGEAA